MNRELMRRLERSLFLYPGDIIVHQGREYEVASITIDNGDLRITTLPLDSAVKEP